MIQQGKNFTSLRAIAGSSPAPATILWRDGGIGIRIKFITLPGYDRRSPAPTVKRCNLKLFTPNLNIRHWFPHQCLAGKFDIGSGSNPDRPSKLMGRSSSGRTYVDQSHSRD